MALGDLTQERYISLTTFKRDGTPVATPVWVAGDDGRLLVIRQFVRHDSAFFDVKTDNGARVRGL